MQVFKAFLKSARKYLPINLMYFVIFCTIAVAATNFNTNKEHASFRTAALDIGIIDKDGSDASGALCEYLESMHTLTPLAQEKEVLLDKLFYRTLDYVLILPEGFEEDLFAGEKKNLYETVQIPGVYSSAFIDEQIYSYLKTLRLCLAGGFTPKDALSHTAAELAVSSNQVQLLKPEDDTQTDSRMSAVYYFYQFLAYVIISMILTGLTPILTIFQEKNLAKRISCSSTSLLSRNLQIALGSTLYCLGIWVLFIVTSRILYGSAICSKEGLLCIANSFLLLPVGVSISLIVSCFAPSGNTINMINNILTLGMSFLCGIFIPQQMLGKGVLAFSKFLPLYWYIKNNDLISGFGGEPFTMHAYRTHLGILVLYGIALFSLALAISKYKSLRQKA